MELALNSEAEKKSDMDQYAKTQNESILHKLRSSPIKFDAAPKPPPESVSKNNYYKIAVLYLGTLTKKHARNDILYSFNSIRGSSEFNQLIESKSITINFSRNSRYIKPNYFRLLGFELIDSAKKTYIFRLRLHSFKNLQHFRGWNVYRLDKISVALALNAIANRKKQYAFDILKQNIIEIFYIQKLLNIEAKRTRKRYTSGVNLLKAVLRNYFFQMIKDIKGHLDYKISVNQEYALYYIEEIFKECQSGKTLRHFNTWRANCKV